MASNSGRKSGSSGRSGPRKRVVLGAEDTVRVRYNSGQAKGDAQRKAGSKKGGPGRQERTLERSPASRHGQRISAAKKEERERRQRGIRLRRAGLVVVAIAAVVLLVWGALAATRAPMFRVDSIQTTGGRHLDRAAILKIAAIPPSATLPWLPASAIERRLERNAWVEKAQVSRDYPSTVRITIKERRPVAVVDAGGTDLWVVSTDGHWLGRRSAEESGVVVVRDVGEVKPAVGARVVSKELLNAVKVATGLSPQLRAMTRAISAPTVDKTAVITNEDVEIYIGAATQLAAKDRLIREILRREKGKVVYINVRVVERPTWRGLDNSP